MNTLFGWINVLLISLLSSAMVTTGNGLLEHHLIINTKVQVKQPSTTQMAKYDRTFPYKQLRPFLDSNLFDAERTPDIQLISTSSTAGAPPSSINLILRGISVLGQKAFAFLVNPLSSKEGVYQTGDCVPDDAIPPSTTCSNLQGKLLKVERQFIMVRFQGNDIRIDLKQESIPSAAASVAAASSATFKANTVPQRKSVGRFDLAQEGDELQVSVPNQEVSNAFENLAQILQDARVTPFTDGDTKGFQIREIVPESVFDKLHLQDFDVLQEVNGESLTTADKALNLFTAFRNEKNITLKLLRSGQPITMQYTVE